MSEIAHREFHGELEIRSRAEGRTVHGLIVPFNTKTRVREGGRSFTESFRPGSFARTLSHAARNGFKSVKLLDGHDQRGGLLGRALDLREERQGVFGEFLVSDTTAGNEKLEMVRDGTLDSFSVGFTPIFGDPEDFLDNMERDDVDWVEVALRETSLVTFGAYPDAMILGVRDDAPSEGHTGEQSPAELAVSGTSEQLDTESPASEAPTGMTRGQREAWLRSHALG